MFTVQLAQAFGQGPDVPVPQLDTNVVSIGATLSQAESNLKSAFNALQVASVAAPLQTIAPEIIQAYTSARNGFVASVKVWIDGYNQTPVDQRNPDDPNALPVLPPEIGVVTSSGFGGFGVVPTKGVLPSQLFVKYGPIGREKTSGLAASYYDPHFAYYGVPTTSGLGIAPVVIVLGLLLLAGTIIAVTALLTKESDAAKIARADADRQASVSDAANKALAQRRDLILACVGSTTGDANKLAACTAAADQGAISLLGALPQIKPSATTTGSILMTIGVVAVIAVIAGGSYMIYRRGQRTSGGSLPRATARPRHGREEDVEY